MSARALSPLSLSVPLIFVHLGVSRLSDPEELSHRELHTNNTGAEGGGDERV